MGVSFEPKPRVLQSDWDAQRAKTKAKAAKTIKANADKAAKALAKARGAKIPELERATRQPDEQVEQEETGEESESTEETSSDENTES